MNMKHRIVVYTAIYDDKDDLKEPSVELEGCSLVCFTNNKYLKSKVFDVRVYPSIHSDPVRSAKIFKVLPHWFFADYEYSLWIDGSVIFKRGDIGALIDNYLREHNTAFFAHPDRDCIYDEAEACITLQRDNAEIIREQIEQYRDKGYPPHNGLVESGIILRRHLSTDVIRVDEDWWAQISRFSRRDQLSFNYVGWKNNFTWATIEGNLRDNDYFSVMSHKRPLMNKVLQERYYKIVDKLLPPHTIVRRGYNLGLIGIRVILNEGFIIFWFKTRKFMKRRT